MTRIDYHAIADDLVREFGTEVPLEAIQERLESLGVAYDHTDVAEIEFLVDRGGSQ